MAGKYWSNEGVYQEEWDALYEKLVPSTGMAPTVAGEAMRAASRLCHEMHNNGWGNNVSGPYFFLRWFFSRIGEFEIDSVFEDPCYDGFGKDLVSAVDVDEVIDEVYKAIVENPELQTMKNTTDMWTLCKPSPHRDVDSDVDM